MTLSKSAIAAGARVPICGWSPRPSHLRGPGRSEKFGDAGRSLPAWEPRGHLLDDPQIAVGIVEGAERPVAGALGVGAALARLDGERGAVPDVAHVDAKLEKPVMGRHNVRDDKGALRRAWRGRVQSQAERDRGRRARRSELDEAQSIHRRHVVVEPPTQSRIEPLGSVDVSHGDNVIFEVQLGYVGRAHGDLLLSLVWWFSDASHCR